MLPTASGEPREAGGRGGTRFVRKHGFASEIVPIDKDNYRTSAHDPNVVRMLDRFGSFYFTGGDQAIIVKALIQDGGQTPALAGSGAPGWLAG